MNNLPASIRELIEVIGLGPALALVRAFGGTRIKVPARDGPGGRLRERLFAVLGEEVAERFIDHYAGEILSIARCAQALRDERDRRIIAAYSAGASAASLALGETLTERRIRDILKRSPGEAGAFALTGPESGQGVLF